MLLILWSLSLELWVITGWLTLLQSFTAMLIVTCIFIKQLMMGRCRVAYRIILQGTGVIVRNVFPIIICTNKEIFYFWNIFLPNILTEKQPDLPCINRISVNYYTWSVKITCQQIQFYCVSLENRKNVWRFVIHLVNLRLFCECSVTVWITWSADHFW